MKKIYLILLALLASLNINSNSQNNKTDDNENAKYKNGTYEAKTADDYEGYHSEAKVNISGNKIADVQWKIIDSNGIVFDDKYEKVFAGNPAYQQQARDDYKGAVTYGPKLIETQDMDKVDSISGATWSYKKFKEVVSEALEKSETAKTAQK